MKIAAFDARTGLLFFSSLFSTCVCADGTNYFDTPPAPDSANALDFSKNPVYTIGMALNVQWMTNWTNISMLLSQNNNKFRPVLIDNKPNPGSMQWTVSYNDFNGQLNPDDPVMQFVLYEAPTQNHVYSHWFNISATSTNGGITTSANSPAGKNATSDTVDEAAASTSSTAAPPSTSPVSSDNSLSTGLGIGLGLGLPLLTATVVGFIFLIKRRPPPPYRLPSHAWPPPPPPHSEQGYPPPFGMQYPSQPPIMMPGRGGMVPIGAGRTGSGDTTSGIMKPWPQTPPQNEYAAAYDAYGRPLTSAGEESRQVGGGEAGRGFLLEEMAPTNMESQGEKRVFLSELSERGAGDEPKELPALPQTPTSVHRRPTSEIDGLVV